MGVWSIIILILGHDFNQVFVVSKNFGPGWVSKIGLRHWCLLKSSHSAITSMVSTTTTFTEAIWLTCMYATNSYLMNV